MAFVPPYGPVKAQRFLYERWNELSSVNTKEGLANFFRKYRNEFEIILTDRTSSTTVDKLLKSGRIKNHDYWFIMESIKSAILRAGGTKIASWGYWQESQDIDGIELASLINPVHGTHKIQVGDMNVEPPLSYAVKIGTQEIRKLQNATKLIHETIRNQHNGVKTITRADYVIETRGDKVNWGLVDIGESNLTMALIDSISRTFSPNGGTALLQKYVSSLLRQYKNVAENLPENIGLVLEDSEMLQNLPYEVDAMKQEIIHQLKQEGIQADVDVILKEDLLDIRKIKEICSKNYEMFVRCFRGTDGLEVLYERFKQNLYDSPIIDDLRYIPVNQKLTIRNLIEKQKTALEPSIKVPRSCSFKISHNSSSTAQEMFDHAKSQEITDFVLKPAEKNRIVRSMALFYNSRNQSHLDQLRRSLERWKGLGINQAVFEEALGNNALQGYKTEVRVYCFS